MIRTCRNCFQCRATIPLSTRGTSVFDRQLVYSKAKVRCAKGLWMKGNGEEFILRNLPKEHEERVRFRQAERCDEFVC